MAASPSDYLTIGLTIGGTVLAQTAVFAFAVGGQVNELRRLKADRKEDAAELKTLRERTVDLQARMKAQEEARPVAAELSAVLAGLVATVGGLKDAFEKESETTTARFDAIEQRLEQLGTRRRAAA